MPGKPAVVLLCASLLALLGYAEERAESASDSTTVADVLDVREDAQSTAAASQSRVEALDDETLAMISEYNRELARYEDLVTYNDNMRAEAQHEPLRRGNRREISACDRGLSDRGEVRPDHCRCTTCWL